MNDPVRSEASAGEGRAGVVALGWCLFPTELGHCAIAWNATGIVGVQLPEADEAATRARMRVRFPGVGASDPPASVRQSMGRVAAALRGEPDDLRSIFLDMRGVGPFQRRVYALLREVPPGRTITYGALAAQIGEPGASRAVGKALGDNPFAPIVPCHRVLAAGGRSGGFSAEGGVATKLRLLSIEGARFGDQAGLFDA